MKAAGLCWRRSLIIWGDGPPLLTKGLQSRSPRLQSRPIYLVTSSGRSGSITERLVYCRGAILSILRKLKSIAQRLPEKKGNFSDLQLNC